MWNLPLKCISSGLQDLSRVKLCRRICERCSRHPNILMNLDYFRTSQVFTYLHFSVRSCFKQCFKASRHVRWSNLFLRVDLGSCLIGPAISRKMCLGQTENILIFLIFILSHESNMNPEKSVSNPEKTGCRFAHDEQLVMIWKISEVSKSVMLSHLLPWGRQEIANHFAWRSKTCRLAEEHPRYIGNTFESDRRMYTNVSQNVNGLMDGWWNHLMWNIEGLLINLPIFLWSTSSSGTSSSRKSSDWRKLWNSEIFWNNIIVTK